MISIYSDDQNVSIISKLNAVVRNFGPVTVTLGQISLFKQDDRDVLIVLIFGEDVIRLNRIISENFSNVSNFPVFKPHVTIGYVRPNSANHLVGDNRFDGTKVTFDTLMFCPADGEKIPISLGTGPATWSVDELILEDSLLAEFAFCPTGPGGKVKNDCPPRSNHGRWTGDSVTGSLADTSGDTSRLGDKAVKDRHAEFVAKYGQATAQEAARLATDWYTMSPRSHLDAFLNGTLADGAEKTAWAAVQQDTQTRLASEVKGDVIDLYRGIPGVEAAQAVEAAKASGASIAVIPIHDSHNVTHEAVCATGMHDLAENYAAHRWMRHGGDPTESHVGIILHMKVPKSEVVFSTAHSAFTNPYTPGWNEYVVRTGGGSTIRLPLKDIEIIGRAGNKQTEFSDSSTKDTVLPLTLEVRLHPAEAVPSSDLSAEFTHPTMCWGRPCGEKAAEKPDDKKPEEPAKKNSYSKVSDTLKEHSAALKKAANWWRVLGMATHGYLQYGAVGGLVHGAVHSVLLGGILGDKMRKVGRKLDTVEDWGKKRYGTKLWIAAKIGAVGATFAAGSFVLPPAMKLIPGLSLVASVAVAEVAMHSKNFASAAPGLVMAIKDNAGDFINAVKKLRKTDTKASDDKAEFADDKEPSQEELQPVIAAYLKKVQEIFDEEFGGDEGKKVITAYKKAKKELQTIAKSKDAKAIFYNGEPMLVGEARAEMLAANVPEEYVDQFLQSADLVEA